MKTARKMQLNPLKPGTTHGNREQRPKIPVKLNKKMSDRWSLIGWWAGDEGDVPQFWNAGAADWRSSSSTQARSIQYLNNEPCETTSGYQWSQRQRKPRRRLEFGHRLLQHIDQIQTAIAIGHEQRSDADFVQRVTQLVRFVGRIDVHLQNVIFKTDDVCARFGNAAVS